MKRIIFLMYVLFQFTNTVNAQSQYEINEQAAKETQKTYSQMKASLAKLLNEYKENKKFALDIRNSQNKWAKFVDAHLDSVFPLDDDQYGSAHSLCISLVKGKMAQFRLDELNSWRKSPVSQPGLQTKAEYSKIDKELNKLYQQVIHSQAKEIPSFLKKMTIAEKAWIAFRDADADAYASSKNNLAARSEKLIQLTKARNLQLKKWIDGVKEGDVCAGSYPVR